MWEIYYTGQSQKDARKIASAGLKQKAQELLAILKINPFSESASL